MLRDLRNPGLGAEQIWEGVSNFAHPQQAIPLEYIENTTFSAVGVCLDVLRLLAEFAHELSSALAFTNVFSC